MAKVKPSKSGNKPSIVRHPLFPATVALWFGALFGIGSLAIRPSLIESVVISLGIDVIAPVMAPPLGVTTRILLALAMAALGGTLGARLARRIARPKPVKVQRKRGAGKTAVTAESGLAARGSRRAALAPDHNLDDARSDYNERAPVPGSAKILDVSQFDLEGFEAVSEKEAEAVETLRETETHVEARAEPWESADPAARVPEGAQVFQPVAEAEPAEELRDLQEEAGAEPEAGIYPDFNSPAASRLPVSEPETGAPATTEQSFGNPTALEPAASATQESAAPQVFEVLGNESGAEPVDTIDEYETSQAFEEQPLERLSNEADDPHVPLPPKARAGSIFDQQPSAGLFAKPLNAQVSHVGWDNGSPLGAAPAAPAVNVPEEASAPAAPPPRDEHHGERPAPAAAERIEKAPLDDLSHVELLERLALSMRRKRSQATVAQVAPAADPVSAEDETDLEPHYEDIDEPVVANPAPPVPTIPEALRPVGLDDDEEADLLPAFVPPRHFAQPQGTPGAQPAPTQAESIDELEEGYSSLLSLSRPGAGPQRFVRIEEPAPLSDEVEPVVVFPGQEPVVGEGPFARPAAAKDDSVDAPADAAGKERPDSSARRLDSDETDRALRTALANLQRMSGAA